MNQPENTNAKPGSTRLLKAQDVAWLLFMAAMIAALPETNYDAVILLVLIFAFQIVEPRLKTFASRRGQVASMLIKILLSYFLIGFTHGITTFFPFIFLLPVVSAATSFRAPGAALVTLSACVAYGSFALPIFVDWRRIAPEDLKVICLHMAFYALVAFLVYQQAQAKREEMKRTEEAASRLAETNRHLREAQASLRRSERLAALGQLTAGLAHELRNPLGTIKASADMLTKQSTRSRPELMSEMAGFISSEVDRVNGLISSFLDFARPLQIRPTTADLKTVIDDVVRQQRDLAQRRGVTLSTPASTDNTAFRFDPDLLKIAVSNIVQNAIQASNAGQRVELRTEFSDQDARIYISDHGKGIEPQHLESIFNPFFTTRTNGVGLGLAIVSKIIDEHQGQIHVTSEPGLGTTFEITIPKGQ